MRVVTVPRSVEINPVFTDLGGSSVVGVPRTRKKGQVDILGYPPRFFREKGESVELLRGNVVENRGKHVNILGYLLRFFRKGRKDRGNVSKISEKQVKYSGLFIAFFGKRLKTGGMV